MLNCYRWGSISRSWFRICWRCRWRFTRGSGDDLQQWCMWDSQSKLQCPCSWWWRSMSPTAQGSFVLTRNNWALWHRRISCQASVMQLVGSIHHGFFWYIHRGKIQNITRLIFLDRSDISYSSDKLPLLFETSKKHIFESHCWPGWCVRSSRWSWEL